MEKYFDIHVKYDDTNDSPGYSIFLKLNVNNKREALDYAIAHHMFSEDGDESCVDYIAEITKDEYLRAVA